MFAKLINGVLCYAPRNYRTDTGQLIINFNKNEDLMKQYGYKEIIDIRPAYDIETQYIRVVDYTDNEDNIVINYEIIDRLIAEQMLTLEERVTTIEEQLSEQSIIFEDEINN